MPIALLIISVLLPTAVLRKQRGYIYSFCFSAMLYFCLVTMWSVAIQILTRSQNHWLIQYLVLISELVYLYFQTNNKVRQKITVSPYIIAAATSIVILFALGIAFNSVRLYNIYGSIPIIGTNDDNANHMAMATAAIKGNSLLFDSKLINEAINEGMVIPATKWYPIGLYANTAHAYYAANSLSTNPGKFNLSTVFNLFAIYIPIQLIIFVFLIFQHIDGIYSSKSIASFVFLFTAGFFIILNEFYLKLFLYGFHAQLAAFNLVLVLFIEAREISRRGRMTDIEMILISTLLFVIGLTYYLFIPIAATMYFLLHTSIQRKLLNYIPYLFLVLGTIPLLMFNFTQNIESINTAYGAAFISITGLLTGLIGILVCALMKEKKDSYVRTVCILATGLTIVQMITTTFSFFKATNNFGYYFFKSYWTIGLLGLPPLAAFLTRHIDYAVSTSSFSRKVLITFITICLSGGIFYTVFSQDIESNKGYDLLLQITNGYGNYFSYESQRKWISMSDKYDSNNGSKIYVLGKWGQFILGHFVYGDSPPIVKRLFREGKWALTDATVNDYARAIVEDLLTRRKIHIIDNEEIMKKYIIYISDKKTQDMVKSTQIFDAE